MPVPARIVVEPPPRPGCGDYASNVALQLAGPAGRPAREVAEILRKRLAGSAGIARVEIAGPGFLNFTLGDGALIALVRDVLAQGDGYGGTCAAQRPDDVGDAPGGGSGDGSGDAFDAHGSGDAIEGVLEGVFGPGAGSSAGGAREAVVGEVLGRIDAAAGPGGRRGGDRPALAPVPYDLATLTARLGSDEARWVLLRPAAHDPVRVPERPVQRESNPRFRVQYACARARALVRNAGELGFVSEPGNVGLPAAVDGGAADARPASQPSPRHPAASPSPSRSLHALQTLLATYPSVIDVAARLRAPDRVVRHLEATADAFFRWHDDFPPLPVGEQKPLAVHRARLALAEASGTVLANGLRLLGISAPAHL